MTLGLLENGVGVGFAQNRNPDVIVGGASSGGPGSQRRLDLHVSGGNGRVPGGEAAGRRPEFAAGSVVARGRERDAAGAGVLRIDLALAAEWNVQRAHLGVVVR